MVIINIISLIKGQQKNAFKYLQIVEISGFNKIITKIIIV